MSKRTVAFGPKVKSEMALKEEVRRGSTHDAQQERR
jgi:hypothetical protein